MITKEEYIKAAEKEQFKLKRYRIIFSVMFIPVIAFIVLYSFSENNIIIVRNTFYHYSFWASVVYLLILLNLELIRLSNARNRYHIKLDRYFDHMKHRYKDTAYSFYAENMLTDLSSSGDIFVSAFWRNHLADHYIVTGDSEKAFENLVIDPGLFEKDPYFELLYLNRLINFYAEFDSTPQGLQIAEEIVKRFDQIKSGRFKTNENYIIDSCDFDNRILLSFMRGEYAECRELLDLRTDNFKKLVVRKRESILIALDELRKAKCLYYLGEYEAASELIGSIRNTLTAVLYRSEDAVRLDRMIKSALNNSSNGE